MLIGMIQVLTLMGLVLLLITLWSNNDDLVIITGLLGVFTWAIVCYGLFNVESTGSNQVYQAGEYVGAAYLALACSLTCLWPALTGPIELVNNARNQDDPFGRGGV